MMGLGYKMFEWRVIGWQDDRNESMQIQSCNQKIPQIQIQTMEVEMKNTDATIEKFCKELGIEAPF